MHVRINKRARTNDEISKILSAHLHEKSVPKRLYIPAAYRDNIRHFESCTNGQSFSFRELQFFFYSIHRLPTPSQTTAGATFFTLELRFYKLTRKLPIRPCRSCRSTGFQSTLYAFTLRCKYPTSLFLYSLILKVYTEIL